MHTIRCVHCGQDVCVPDLAFCPICGITLWDKTAEFSKKHLSRCAIRINPYVHTGRKRGRPSKAELWAIHGFDIENDK